MLSSAKAEQFWGLFCQEHQERERVVLAAGLFRASLHSPVSGHGASKHGDAEPRLPQVFNSLKTEASH